MKSLADGLRAEIARQIHPDWRKNEAAYWAVRDQLLGQYQGQWIGFADGVVIASGARPVVVFHAAHQAAEHPYLICVGREEEPDRMLRANFAYDTSYPAEALPVIRAEFRRLSGWVAGAETAKPRTWHRRLCHDSMKERVNRFSWMETA